MAAVISDPPTSGVGDGQSAAPTQLSPPSSSIPSSSSSTTTTQQHQRGHHGGPSVEVLPNACTRDRPECRIIIYNVAKKANVGNIVRSAVAMGVSRMIIVGNVAPFQCRTFLLVIHNVNVRVAWNSAKSIHLETKTPIGLFDLITLINLRSVMYVVSYYSDHTISNHTTHVIHSID
jgi:hypothetical protein